MCGSISDDTFLCICQSTQSARSCSPQIRMCVRIYTCLFAFSNSCFMQLQTNKFKTFNQHKGETIALL